MAKTGEAIMPLEERTALPLKGIRFHQNPAQPTLAIVQLKTEAEDFFCLATKPMLELLAKECMAAAEKLQFPN